jgi:hypothetical protein
MAFVLNFSLAHAAFADNHLYHTGILQSLGNNQAILSGRTFILTPTVQVIVRAKKKGAYYEQGEACPMSNRETRYISRQRETWCQRSWW